MNWIGSSHFKPSHHLPKAFQDLVAKNPDLYRFSQEPEITTIYVMRDNFIEKTLKKVSESGPGPRVAASARMTCVTVPPSRPSTS